MQTLRQPCRLRRLNPAGLQVIPGGALIPMLAMLANSYMTAAMGGYLCLHFLAWVVRGRGTEGSAEGAGTHSTALFNTRW